MDRYGSRRIRIAFASVTYAEKGKRVLSAAGINSLIIRLAPGETKKGCGFALEISRNSLDRIGIAGLRKLLADGHVRYTEILV